MASCCARVMFTRAPWRYAAVNSSMSTDLAAPSEEVVGGTNAGKRKPQALSLLASERPRDVGWLQAAGLLFGDWGTSRLYVLGLAFFFASRTSFWLICAMSLLILAVGWAYSQI